jgi:hypothetical protein
MVTYHGSIATGAVFDPMMLSAAFGQIKNKSKPDTTAKIIIWLIGLPHNLSQPLPYLALLLELGTESFHNATHSKIKVTTPKEVMMPKPNEKGKFQVLVDNWLAAVQALADYQKGQPRKGVDLKWAKKQLAEKQNVVKEMWDTMDNYNQYTIAVCGVSADVYGILHKANIEEAFLALLSTMMPSPTAQDEVVPHMQPLE